MSTRRPISFTNSKMTALGKARIKSTYVTLIDKRGQDNHFSCNMGQFTNRVQYKPLRLLLRERNMPFIHTEGLGCLQAWIAAMTRKLSPSGEKSQSNRQMGIFPEMDLFRCTEDDIFKVTGYVPWEVLSIKLSGQDLNIILHLPGENNPDWSLRYFQALLEGCSHVNVKPPSFTR